ncbi:MAG: hypothetical protein OEV00_06200, partial [Acidobacteriota bacterium]|nr:hypothetical protein [Acidobacteriota bacterium]
AGSEYSAHDEALVAMKLALPALLEDPQSVDLLFDVLRSGEKACWHLTRYRRVAESYGSLPEYQAAVAPAAEACRKLGRAGFSAPVRAALVEGLAQDSERDDQLGELREEIAALEELFEDLRRIEAADP